MTPTIYFTGFVFFYIVGMLFTVYMTDYKNSRNKDYRVNVLLLAITWVLTVPIVLALAFLVGIVAILFGINNVIWNLFDKKP